ncbi:MAG: hypothetical protein ACTSRS_06305 [Candidatus Helarchaeota archaeon]
MSKLQLLIDTVPDVDSNLNLMVTSFQLIIAIIFAILFYQEWRKQKRAKNEQYIPLALSLMFAMVTIGSFLIINSNFFISESLSY